MDWIDLPEPILRPKLQDLNLSWQEFQILRAFDPEGLNRRGRLLNGGRVAHYTSVSGAIDIAKSNTLWMRNARYMEDRSEIRYGTSVVENYFFGEDAECFWRVLDSAHPGISNATKELFFGWKESTENETYITCLTEHDTEEDQDGRLSMWRLRRSDGGSKYNVAIVVNPIAFLIHTNAIMTWAFPVTYDEKRIQTVFQNITCRIVDSAEIIGTMPRDDLVAHAFSTLVGFAVSIKHPGFREEQEWRIVHLPQLWPSKNIERKLERPNGEPELVYKLPLQNIQEEGLVGVTIPEFLDRVIIGPMDIDRSTKAYGVIAEVLKNEVGISNPENKIKISSIPI